MRREKDGPNGFGYIRPGCVPPSFGGLTRHEAISVIARRNISRFPDFLREEVPLNSKVPIDFIAAKETYHGIKRCPQG
jgi:hypothetical protein